MEKLVTLGLVGGAVFGLAISRSADAAMAPVVVCALVGGAIGLGLAFVLRLGRIGHKALTKIEKKLDED